MQGNSQKNRDKNNSTQANNNATHQDNQEKDTMVMFVSQAMKDLHQR